MKQLSFLDAQDSVDLGIEKFIRRADEISD